MASQKISSGKSISTEDLNLDVRQSVPSNLQVETTPLGVTDTNLQEVNGTALTPADWTTTFSNILNSLGNAGVSPINTSGSTLLQLLTTISNALTQSPKVTTTLLISSSEILTVGVNEDLGYRDITNEGVILIDGILNVYGTSKNNGSSFDNGIIHNNGTMKVN